MKTKLLTFAISITLFPIVSIAQQETRAVSPCVNLTIHDLVPKTNANGKINSSKNAGNAYLINMDEYQGAVNIQRYFFRELGKNFKNVRIERGVGYFVNYVYIYDDNGVLQETQFQKTVESIKSDIVAKMIQFESSEAADLKFGEWLQ